MRKLSLIAANVFLAATVLFTSCKKEDEDPQSISLSAVAEDGFVTSSADVEPGETFMVKLTTQKIDKNLETFSITADNTTPTIVSVTGFEDSDVEFVNQSMELSGDDRDGFTIEIMIETPNLEGDITYTFEVTDRDGNVGTKEIMINTSGSSSTDELKSYSATLLGVPQNGSASTFMDADYNQVYSISNAKTNATTVDFGYFYGNSNLATIAAPSASEWDDFSASFSGLGPDSWSTRNATKLMQTDLDFDAATYSDVDDLDFLLAGNIENELQVGDVVAFETALGNKGIFKVTGISGTNTGTGSITIDIKVQ